MNREAVQGLINNAALLLALGVLYDVLLPSQSVRTWRRQMVLGLIIGGIGIAVMKIPWHLQEGIVFDTRSILLSIAALFFGTIPATLAAGIAAVFRWYGGGAGAVTGLMVITASTALGLAWRHLRSRNSLPGWLELYLFGVAVHVVMLVCMLTLGWSTGRYVLSHIALPVMAIYPVATLLLGGLLVHQQTRHQALQALQQERNQLKRLNRVYAVLSNINQAIVRIRQPQALFEEACRIAARDGGFLLAWMGTVDEEGKEIRVVARAGPCVSYLDDLRISLHDEPWGRGPTGSAVRDGRPVVVTDISRDERMAPWRARALAAGFRSSAAFPLKVGGEVRGVLSLYAGEPRFFDEAEVRLLDELAMDLSFAMEFAEREQERKRAEARLQQMTDTLRESEARYRSLFENTHAVMLLVDPDGGIVDANPAACAYYGWTRQQLTSMRIDQINTLSACQVAEHMRLALARKCNHFLFQHRLADGSVRDVEVYSGPIQYQGKNMLFSVIHDVSERVCAEKQRDRAEAQLRQAQKMEAIGRLAGGVAHDFNNMLTVILGYADTTLRKLDPGDAIYHNLQEIRNAAERSADLTRQLLAFSRKQIIQPAVIDLNERIAGQQKMLSRLIGEDIRIEWIPAPDLWPVRIDPSQIDQILANLAANARDAIPDTGTFTIETANVTLDESYGRRNMQTRPGDYVMLAFTDTGHGMDSETLERIFEPFFTTRSHGTGLGLSTVYGIVAQNGGVIHAYSEPGHGTTFKIYLPRFTGPAEPVAGVELTNSLDGCETVLIVEDEEPILKIAQIVLQGHGYSVLTARSPAEACQVAENYAGNIHLLLTDVVMPGMNGRQLADKALAIQPGLKVLYTTGYTRNAVVHNGVLDPGTNFLAKPFTIEDLAMKVRQALDS